MADVPLLLAVASGMVAAVNPCGFALLPAYLGLLLAGDDDGAATGRVVGRALFLSAAMTAGFVAVFATFGLLLAPVAGRLTERLPWLTVALGLLLVAPGVWLLTGRRLPAPRIGRGRAPALTGSASSMALFGVGYASASLTCTIGPFLAVVVSSAKAGSTAEGLLLFLAYAAGMGLVVATAAVAVSLARVSVVNRMRRTGRVVPHVAGAILILTGCYVAYYGWYEIRLAADPGQALTDPIAGAGSPLQELQHWLADGLGRLGVPAMTAVFLLVLAAAAAHRLWRQRDASARSESRQ